MATRLTNLKEDSPEAADRLENAADEAHAFYPVTVRGLPNGREFGPDGTPIRGLPDGPVEGPELPELPDLPLGDT
jgi:hypothetical protein